MPMTRISMKALAEAEPERWRKIMTDPLAKGCRDLDWEGAGPLRTPRQRHAAFEALAVSAAMAFVLWLSGELASL